MTPRSEKLLRKVLSEGIALTRSNNKWILGDLSNCPYGYTRTFAIAQHESLDRAIELAATKLGVTVE